MLKDNIKWNHHGGALIIRCMNTMLVEESDRCFPIFMDISWYIRLCILYLLMLIIWENVVVQEDYEQVEYQHG